MSTFDQAEKSHDLLEQALRSAAEADEGLKDIEEFALEVLKLVESQAIGRLDDPSKKQVATRLHKAIEQYLGDGDSVS